MPGAETFIESLFLMKRLNDFVPADQPLRAIREMVNKALVVNLNGLVVNAMVKKADAYDEREAAKAMIHDARQAYEE